MGDFAGKLALVTGAGQGIGRAVAIGLAKQGADVIAADLAEQQVLELAEALCVQGLRCEGRKLDVGDAEAVELFVDELELARPIELLANVAGEGLFHVTRSVARRMKAREQGAIVIVGANAAQLPRARMAAHAASRAATLMFAKGLALDLAEHHVRCSMIAQGSTDRVAPSWAPLHRLVGTDEVAEAALFLLSDRAGPPSAAESPVRGAGKTLPS